MKQTIQTSFLQEVQEILKLDCTQSCNDAEGTDLSILQDKNRITITIKSGISHNTLKRLLAKGYLVSADEKGRIQVQELMLGSD
jgi:hypothetical protein